MPILIRIPTKVKHLEEKYRRVLTEMDGSKLFGKIEFENKSMGWFVHFEGSYESLYVGETKPIGLDPGTEVEVVIVSKAKR